MTRVICSWFPRWPIQRLHAAQPALKRRPLALFSESAQRLRITACCPRAEQHGVRINQSLADAKALLSAASYQPADPDADRAALRVLALDAQRFTPLVGLEDAPAPESLVWDISGCPHLWGGEPMFFQAVCDYWRSRRFTVRLALADTLGAAWAIAHVGPAASLVSSGREATVLSNLPLAALRLPASTLSRLAAMGLYRIRDVQQLPRASLPSRFGPELLSRLDQALGAKSEPFVAERLREPLIVSRAWEEPVTDQSAIGSINRELLRELMAQAAERSCGLHELRGEFQTESTTLVVELQLVEPSLDEKHWQELIALRMDRQAWPGGVLRITWIALRLGILHRLQGRLFADDELADSARAIHALVDRLTSRLGTEAVLRAEVRPDPQPEQAVVLIPWSQPRPTEEIPFIAEQWRNRPLRLLPAPEAIEVMSVVPDGPPLRMTWQGRSHRVTGRWGPERIETGWWRNADVQRDYYRAEWETGTQVWVYRDRKSGHWFLHGFFD
ncbi:MAG TPA: DNA polymerase Y family protein [Planctomycetaceae bacterium]|nr:DNA polymerase Y family protein [Planctomycetaceae bacterium]